MAKNNWSRAAYLAVLAIAGACYDASLGKPQAGGHTNWLECQTLDDCVLSSRARKCSGGYCLDDDGNRIAATDAASDEVASRLRHPLPAEQTIEGSADAGSEASGQCGTGHNAISVCVYRNCCQEFRDCNDHWGQCPNDVECMYSCVLEDASGTLDQCTIYSCGIENPYAISLQQCVDRYCSNEQL
jgi:hypothetical protein